MIVMVNPMSDLYPGLGPNNRRGTPQPGRRSVLVLTHAASGGVRPPPRSAQELSAARTYLRRVRSAFASMRDTCICEQPSSSAMRACVISSRKRISST